MPTTYNRIDENTDKTIIFVSAFIIFLFAAAYIVDLLLFKNHFYAALFLVIVLLLSFSDYIFSNRLILRENRAVPMDPELNEELYRMVENICVIAGVPMPKLYTNPDMAINAFTIGKNFKNASIVLTRGAIERLERSELEGVVAHEISHIQNNDVMLSTVLVFMLGFVRKIVNILVNIIDFFADMIRSEDAVESLIKTVILGVFFIIILAGLILVFLLSCIPLIEELIFYGISRKREFLADAEGVLFTRYPKGLADALEKISQDDISLETTNTSTAHLYIASPFKDNLRIFWRRLFHSHPPIEKRIEILRNMDEYGEAGYNN
ncbi:MAG: M48 family metalloprotease [Minisyncoccia bacterium]